VVITLVAVALFSIGVFTALSVDFPKIEDLRISELEKNEEGLIRVEQFINL
jgi:hypothetical protein